MTPRGDHRGGEGVGAPGPRRRRIPDRAQVVVHAQGQRRSRTTSCCNADESEPGTFKDREIMRWTPHALIEGCAIAAYAIGAERCYIYIRGEFTEPWKVMEQAVDEAYANGALGDNVFGSGKRIEIVLHRGRRRLHLRRRDRDDELDRGQARQPAHQAAVPGGGRPLRHADHDQQRRDARRGAAHPQPRRRLVQGALPRQPQEHRHQAVLGLRPRAAARATTRSRWASR